MFGTTLARFWLIVFWQCLTKPEAPEPMCLDVHPDSCSSALIKLNSGGAEDRVLYKFRCF